MRILIVTQYFWPENFRINDLTSALEKRGHDITILTGKPNYPTGVLFKEYKSNPAAFLQYGKSKIVRVPVLLRGESGKLRLLMNYVSYVLSASIIGSYKLRKHQFDVIFVFEPSPVTVGLPALIMKWCKKAPVIFWVLDLWPDTLEAIEVVKSPRILKLVGKLVSYIYNRCDLVLGQSKSFCTEIAKYCVDHQKIKYFPSWADDGFNKVSKEVTSPFPKDKGIFKILFAGNVGDAQDFGSILDAAEILKRKKAKICFYIAGDGRMFDWVKQQISERQLESVLVLLGRHPLSMMPNFYQHSDALLVSLKSSEVFAKTIPGKVQSYLLAGKPLLGMLDGEGAKVIEDANAGLTCQAGNYVQLAENSIHLSQLSKSVLTIMGQQARDYADKEFDRVSLITQLESWMKQLARSK